MSTVQVCYQCFGDQDLRHLIRGYNGPRGCSFCHRKDAATMPFHELANFIKSRIKQSFGYAADQLPYESREGGYQGWYIDSYDMIQDELSLEFPREDNNRRLFYAVVDGIGDDTWCQYDWLVLEPDESLRFSWKRFCETVKYRRRFFFHHVDGYDGHDPDSRSPVEFLTTVCGYAERLKLIVEKPAGLKLYRARPRKARHPFTKPGDLGPPPENYATQSNRMNPPGIPMFYGADRRNLAVAEIRDLMASVGTFQTTRPIRILDLASLPAVPGFFSEASRLERLLSGFIREFANLIILPVERSERVNVDYIPTQVFTEFLRDFQFNAGGIDGLRYRSATGERGSNYVLFAGQHDIEDAAPPEHFVHHSPWIKMIGVKQIRT